MLSLSEDFRSDIRFFAFFLGNGTLLPKDVDFDSLDYTECATRKDDTIGRVFAVYLNNKQRALAVPESDDAIERASQWLTHRCHPAYQPAQAFDDWEVALASEHLTITDCIKQFALALGRGTFAPALLATCDYVPSLIEYGSFLEQIVAIFTNILQRDDDWRAYNIEQATQRTAQYIRNSIDPTYEIVPPFATWEVELL